MSSRKRRNPTSAFGMPLPFNPMSGEHATLRAQGVHPYCAMMQVAAADTHTDYVICRGFDPRSRKFIDYESGNDDKPGIPVAKPYGNRSTSQYQIGEIYPAFLPTQGTPEYVPPSPTTVDWRVGQNAGTASPTGTGGHPQDLSASISELTDSNSKNVQWMLISGGGGTPSTVLWGVAKTNWNNNGANCDSVVVNPCDDCEGSNPDVGTEHTVLLPKTAEQDPNVIQDEVIGYERALDGTYCCNSDYLDDKIGTVKMWAGFFENVPPGWEIMDGVQNSAGSGIDMTYKFPLGHAQTAGNTGGRTSHIHELFITIASHSQAALSLALDHTHRITINDHSEEDLVHYHQIDPETPSLGWETNAITWDGAAHTQWTPDRNRRVDCTDPPNEDHDCAGGDWGPLTHTYKVFPAFQTATANIALEHENLDSYMDEQSHMPPYATLIFIERVDNSA